jgi:hypothetical protein
MTAFFIDCIWLVIFHTRHIFLRYPLTGRWSRKTWQVKTFWSGNRTDWSGNRTEKCSIISGQVANVPDNLQLTTWTLLDRKAIISVAKTPDARFPHQHYSFIFYSILHPPMDVLNIGTLLIRGATFLRGKNYGDVIRHRQRPLWTRSFPSLSFDWINDWRFLGFSSLYILPFRERQIRQLMTIQRRYVQIWRAFVSPRLQCRKAAIKSDQTWKTAEAIQYISCNVGNHSEEPQWRPCTSAPTYCVRQSSLRFDPPQNGLPLSDLQVSSNVLYWIRIRSFPRTAYPDWTDWTFLGENLFSSLETTGDYIQTLIFFIFLDFIILFYIFVWNLLLVVISC